jgi:type IV pilus assembly protein PilQ
MMSATNRNGVGKGLVQALRRTAVGLGLMLVSASALAGNVLQDVRYAAAPGGKVDITLQFSAPVGDVQAFTTDSPPRIALDLPDTSNGLTTRRVVIGSGATKAVSAAEAGGRTRVVVDLLRPAGYTTRSAGNTLVLTVDAGAPQLAGVTPISVSDPTKRSAATLHVSNIDFRRGDNGAGRIIMRFDGAGAATDMRNDGKQVVIDVSNASIPENLRRRLDVTDFATPVVSVEPRSNAGGSRLIVNTNGAYESMAYQTGNEYVVEITPKRGAVVAGAPMGVARNAGAVTIGGTGRYVGKPVTFNFQDVPVRTVLQLIAEESGLNIVVADTVSGSVTLRLINVPWDQALEIVLRAKGLDQRRDGNVVWVAPQAELSAYELAQANSRIALENSGELVVEYIPINYGSAVDLVQIIQGNSGGAGGGGGGGAANGGQRGLLSARGTVSADVRTNTLLVSDTRKKIDEIRKMLLVLDRPVDQVLIEARIVIADDTFARELGARLGISNPNVNSDSISNISGTIEANNATINSFVGAANDATGGTTAEITQGFLTNLGVTGAAGSIAYSILRGSSLLDVELSALQEEGRGEVVSNPRVITTNQREATITQGDEIGYTTPQAAGAGQALATPAFKEALLELKVTPTITTDGRVFMAINIKKDDIKGFTQGVPSLTKRSVTTGVMVDSGDTVVIGGVYEFRNRNDVTKVPWLADLPILGHLFKKTGKTSGRAELLVFVTPRVLQVAQR